MWLLPRSLCSVGARQCGDWIVTNTGVVFAKFTSTSERGFCMLADSRRAAWKCSGVRGSVNLQRELVYIWTDNLVKDLINCLERFEVFYFMNSWLVSLKIVGGEKLR